MFLQHSALHRRRRPARRRPVPSVSTATTSCLRPVACGLWPVACGLWPVARGLWPVARGPWPVARGPWPVACGLLWL